jgi:transposase-like protein
MARRIDVKLQESWRRRLAGFRPDRETVRQFCRRAGIAVPSYYYWRRRLAEPRRATPETAVRESPHLGAESFVELAVGVSGTVEVELPSGVRIRVPARSTDALVTAIRTAAEVSSEVPTC